LGNALARGVHEPLPPGGAHCRAIQNITRGRPKRAGHGVCLHCVISRELRQGEAMRKVLLLLAVVSVTAAGCGNGPMDPMDDPNGPMVEEMLTPLPG
jgi:hypothetical protein